MQNVRLICNSLLGMVLLFAFVVYSQAHDLGELLPHFLASEHLTKNCIEDLDKKVTALAGGRENDDPDQNVCTIRTTHGDMPYYKFRDSKLVQIEVFGWHTSYNSAVSDITSRYGKPSREWNDLQFSHGMAEGRTTFWKTAHSRIWVISLVNADTEGNSHRGVRVLIMSDAEFAVQGLGDNRLRF